MKSYKIGDADYKLCETAEDLSIVRYNELKVFMIQKDAGIDLPSLMENYKQRMQAYNTQSIPDLVIADYNFINGLQTVMDRTDSEQMIFALIVLEDGEEQTKFDRTQAREKLKRMNEQGLTQGEVSKVVKDFILGSPILSEYSFLMSLESLQQR